MSTTYIDESSPEDSDGSESDLTPISSEEPTVQPTKRRRRVGKNRVSASSRTEIISLQGYGFRIESKQKAEGIV